MKLCRFQLLLLPAGESLPLPRYGVVRGETVREVAGDIFEDWQETTREWPLEDVRLLPPVTPGKIVCIGRNYQEHAAELGNVVPKEPLIFLKPPSSVIGPEEPILLPSISRRVDHEGEVAVVIGRRCSRPAAEADLHRYILGFTCLNDVTARDIQKADVQFTRGKGFDTFCPIGPVIETQFELAAARVECFVNGQRRQSAPATEMIFSVDVIIRWIADVMALEPGDVIATGTPSGVGPLAAGDVVEVSVTGIGTLRNPVAARES